MQDEEVVFLLILTPSCRHCTSQHSPSAAAPPSVWWRSCWRWSARNCKCWRSSGRSLGAPDTQQRVGPWSLSNSYLMMSETGLHPHHLNLYAATYTGNNVTIRYELILFIWNKHFSLTLSLSLLLCFLIKMCTNLTSTFQSLLEIFFSLVTISHRRSLYLMKMFYDHR